LLAVRKTDVSGTIAILKEKSVMTVPTLGSTNGGTGINSPGAAGNVLKSDGTNWIASPESGGVITQTPFTSSSSAGDGKFTVAHGLGYSPTAAMIILTELGSVVFQSSTLWDRTNFYLQGSDVGLTGYVIAWK
jgi:hypothetical protein